MGDSVEIAVPGGEWKMLQDQGELPIIDAVRIDVGTVWAIPLKQAFGGIDGDKVFTSLHRLSH